MNMKSSSYNSSYSNLKDAIMGGNSSTTLARKYDLEYSYRQPINNSNNLKSYNFTQMNNTHVNNFEIPKSSVNFYPNKNQNNTSLGLNNERVFSGVVETKRGISENKSRYNFNENFSEIKNYSYNPYSLSSDNFNSPKSNSKSLYASDLIYQEVEGLNKIRPISSSPRNDIRLHSSSSNKSYSSNNSRLLPASSNLGKKTLILDLDETLVHSSFKPFIVKSDIILNIDLERRMHTIHVLKRPGVHEFLERMAKLYEVVIFTASLSPYANPLIDQLDHKRLASYRLFREHCTNVNGMYVKDMKRLGRDLKDVIIIDVR
jgi:carboxy-terminal domain RNA polymerase II polypeptide A small phosphatase